MSARDGVGGSGTLGRRQRFENSEITVRIYPGALAEGTIYCPISARKTTTAAEAIERVIDRLQLDRTRCYVLAERLPRAEDDALAAGGARTPLAVGRRGLPLPPEAEKPGRLHQLRRQLQMWLQVTEERRRMVERGLLPQPDAQGDHADLCHLPQLNERSLLDNLRSRFLQEKIYTYVGSILIVINPFRFLPIYNPKYVKMYDNHTLGKVGAAHLRRGGRGVPHHAAAGAEPVHRYIWRERIWENAEHQLPHSSFDGAQPEGFCQRSGADHFRGGASAGGKCADSFLLL
ncbi:unnamed protein product [Tetraodon nigroviridis]|uniref:(spotted green pufferfish) hypothetical protein n=1 Tax=Tetraodon nigroviridis TaxID=99883 RepID=Q4SHH1_TETNG|nr:unnamed protein product [Tetraodon nigroviridis]